MKLRFCIAMILGLLFVACGLDVQRILTVPATKIRTLMRFLSRDFRQQHKT
jgi:hypothetical protein